MPFERESFLQFVGVSREPTLTGGTDVDAKLL